MQINIPTDRHNNAKHKVVNKIKEIKPMPQWAIYTLIATAERFQYEKKYYKLSTKSTMPLHHTLLPTNKPN